MVEFVTPRLVPTAREAAPVNTSTSQALTGLGQALQGTADTFTQYFEEQARIQSELLLAETQSEMSRRFNEAKKNAGAGFTDSFLKTFDEYRAEKLQNAPVRTRDELNLAFDKYRIDLRDRAMAAEAAARAAAAAKARQELLRQRGNALVSDPSLLDQYLEADPKNADYYALTAANARAMTDAEGVGQEFQDGKWDAYVTPSQKQSFIEAGIRARERREREEAALLEAERRDTETQVSEELAYLEQNGFVPADSVINNDDEIDRLFGADAPEFRAAVEDQRAYAEAIYEVNTSPIEDVQAEIARLNERVAAPGDTDLDARRRDNYLAALRRRQQALQEDSAAFVQLTNGAVSAAFDAYHAAEPMDREIAFGQYQATLAAEYARLGVPVEQQRLLPKPVAQSYVRGFQEMGADVVAQSLKALVDETQDPRITAELAAEGLPDEYVSAMRHSDNPGLAAAIVGLAGRTTSDLREGLVGTDATDTSRAIVEELATYRAAFEAGDVTGKAATAFNREFGVAERLALSYVRNGMAPAAAAQRAAKEVFPEEPIVTGNAMVVVPKGIDSGAVEYALDQAMTEDALRAAAIVPLDDPMFAEFQDREVMIAAAQNGMWVNNSTGDGAVLTVDVGGFLLPVTTETGYYEIKFRNAERPSFWREYREGLGRALFLND